ncbi:hypothetical protein BS47DRAFT_1390630 [Hydnum rufescens UP504]|uniref:Uncharacterized protein n=1 Tax=Hydnum rufescens UP504 TaxID=1448309 RepID=A0A9P6B2R3_9AGAM|nr:hypothetical protein BS47DRAFT_1390630 [Hydnum rufescens UP504]
MRARGNRGRGRGGGNRSHRDSSSSFHVPHSPTSPTISPTRDAEPVEEYDPRKPELPRSLSPASLAIARATGDWNSAAPPTSSFVQNQQPFQPYGYGNHPSSSYLPGMGVGMGTQMQYGQSYVAPHINPRFANAANTLDAAGNAQPSYQQDGYSYTPEQQEQGQRAGEYDVSDQPQPVFHGTRSDRVSGDQLSLNLVRVGLNVAVMDQKNVKKGEPQPQRQHSSPLSSPASRSLWESYQALPRRQQLGFAAVLAATGALGLYVSDYLEYSAKADSGEQHKGG